MSATTFPGRLTRPERDWLQRRLRSLVRGDVADPAWVRPALIALLGFTAVAYIINLTASGYANSFYAAAVQAGTKSWKALFFGSIDSSNFITVDKPPASLWVMALSGRIFGFSSASMLIPQALEGVLSIALLYGAVKRWFGASAGLLAGLMLAVTPVAALMFRFNNPDALLVCLLTGSAYCLVRAVEKASTKWLVAVGVVLGFAFLTKMLAAFLVLPGFALVYFVAAPVPMFKRSWQLLAGGAGVVLGCGWWLAAVALWPVASRPMIDGSPDNSIFNLIFGYNGISRVSGSGGGGNFSGATGIFRLFNSLMGGQASWLLPAALISLTAGMWWTRRAPRTDHTRAGLMLWGSWLLVTGAVFSFSSGTVHTYYTVALAPAIAALAAVGAVTAWRHREQLPTRALLAGSVLVTASWAIIVLERTSSWQPWLVWMIGLCALAAIAAIMLPTASKRVRLAGAVLACVACLAAPVAFTASTLSTPHSGTVPTAGPSTGSTLGSTPVSTTGATTTSATSGASAGGPGDVTTSSKLDALLEQDSSKYRWVAATSGSQSAAQLELATNGDAVMAIGGFSGEGGRLTLAAFKKYVAAGDIHYYVVSSGGFTGGGFGGAGRGNHTFGGAAGSGSSVTSLFGGGSSSARPSGAPGGPTSGTGIGAFTRPTGGARGSFGGGAGAGGGSTYSDTKIETWVKAHFTKETVGGQTVYNLADPK